MWNAMTEITRCPVTRRHWANLEKLSNNTFLSLCNKKTACDQKFYLHLYTTITSQKTLKKILGNMNILNVHKKALALF